MTDSSKKKVILVDDNQDVLKTLTHILKLENYEVISTTEGEEAIRLTRQHLPNLIILDIIMPGMAGEDIAAIISEDPAISNIPIVFLTGILTKEEEMKFQKTGNYPVIAKPTTVKEFLEVVNRYMS